LSVNLLKDEDKCWINQADLRNPVSSLKRPNQKRDMIPAADIETAMIAMVSGIGVIISLIEMKETTTKQSLFEA